MTQHRNIVTRTWGSSVGKKSVMAVTGVIFLLYVVAHMIGNLKIFFGQETFDAYSEHLRSLGADIFGYEGVLWIIRVVLTAAVVLHMWAAFSLWYKARRARPIGYQHSARASTATKRSRAPAGARIALFIIWHILDLTIGTVNPDPSGGAYARLIASFDRPVVAIFYIVAMVALSTHISHGLWSGIQTLGGNSAIRQRSLKLFSITVGVVIAVGFAIIPISVMTGLVR